MEFPSEDDAIKHATLVVVPAFREAAAIGTVVSGLRADGWRVLVVDDGSDDATAAIAAAAGAVVVRHAVNLGQGASLRTGFTHALRSAGTEWVVTFDADGQHAPSAVADLLLPLVGGAADVTLGSRFLDPAALIRVPVIRRWLLRAATRLARITTRLPLTDTHNGLRGFTAGALRQIVLTQDRMAHASEILSEIARLHLRVREVPVTVSYTEYSLGKGQRPMDAVSILWDLILNRMR